MMTLLVEAAARALALGLLVGLGLRLCKVRSAQAEMTVWTVVLAAAMAMPAMIAWPILRLPAPAASALARASRPEVYPALGQNTLAQPIMAPLTALPTPSPGGVQLGADLLLGLYAVVASVLLLRLAIGLAKTWRIVRAAKPVVADGVNLRVSAAVKAPVTFGGVVLLPPAYAAWPTAKLQAVLDHERAHVAHRDFTVQTVSKLYSALFWFNPLAWWLQRRLAFLAEIISDEAAVARLGDRADYAEILMGVAAGDRDLSAAIAMARPAMLRQRIERILSQAGPIIALGAKRRIALAACLLPGVLLVGGTALSAAAPENPSPSTPQAAKPADGAEAVNFVIVDNRRGATLYAVGDLTELNPAIARNRIKGVSILFSHGGQIYAISDPALVQRAQDLFRPLVDAAKQKELAGQTLEPLQQQLDGAVRDERVVRQELHALIGEALASGAAVPAASAPRTTPAVLPAPSPTLAAPARLQPASYSQPTESEQTSFLVLDGEHTNSMTLNGDLTTLAPAIRLRDRIKGAAILFPHNGRIYIITDPALTKRANDLFRPQKQLGEQQSQLGQQQSALGEQQAALGRRQGELGAQQGALGGQMAALAAKPDRLAELQRRMAALGEEQGKLGAEQGKLGEKQSALGARQGALGEEQARLGKIAGENMRALIGEALANGAATVAPQP